MDNAWTDVAKGENHTLVRFASGPSPLSDVGGGALLKGEPAGWATDFLYDADPTKRVALKTPPTSKTFYAVDDFFANAGTSPKMVYDSAGVLRWSPHNLYYASEDLTHPVLAGSPGNVTVVSSTQIFEQAISGGHTFASAASITTLAGQPYCYWIEATNAGCDRFMLYGLNLGGQGKGFDLTNGTTFTVSGIPDGGLVNSGILALGGGRYRCWIALTSGGQAGGPSIYLVNGTSYSYLGNPSRGLTIHRQQLNKGTTPLAYLPTTSAARAGLALDYDPVTHAPRGLLCEPQATNTITRSTPPSASVDNWNIRGGLVVTQGQSDPTGGMGAALLNGVTGFGGMDCFVVNGLSSTAGTVCAPSFFIKKVTTSGILQVNEPAGSTGRWDVNLALIGSGWERITRQHPAVTAVIEFTVAPSGGLGLWFASQSGSPLSFHMWGVGIETAGSNVPTSPIPTLGATVTRAGDQVNALAASVGSSTAIGSWWADVNLLTNVAPQTIIATGDSAHLPIYGQAATTFGLYDNIAFVGKTVASIAGSHKVAAAYQAADRAITADGLTVATDATAGVSLGGGPNIAFGYNAGAGGQINGYIRQLRYLPRRPSNAELQTMTALTGGKALLVAELNGMATDFIYAADAERVAVKTAGAVKEFGLDAFYQNTAGSPKQVYTIDGKLGWSPHNLELWSEDFTDAAWVKGDSSVIANATTAPNGTLTADKFVEGTGGGSKYLQQYGARASNGVFSVYAKAGERTKIVLQDWLGGAIGDGFDLVAGVVHVLDLPTLRPTGRSTIKAVGNGWYRCSIGVQTGGDCVMYTADDNWAVSHPGDGVSGLYVWGAQLNYGSALVPYIPTTSAAKAGLALDYDPVTHAPLGLLCEPQATNAVKWSTDMTNAAVWWGDGAFELNAGVAPNGLMEAMKFSGNGFGEYEDGNFLVGAIPGNITGNVSVYAKAGACTQIFLMSATNTFEGFDLATGTIFVPTYNGAVTVSSGLGVMRNVGNGWWRCSVKSTAVGDFWMGMCRNKENVSPGSELSVYLWGPQGDSVNPFPTSYIPTFAAAVTRAADTVSVLPAQINYSASAGSWWVDVNLLRKATVYDIIVGYYTGAAPIYMGSATTFDLYDSPGFVSKAVASAVGSHKVAAAFVTADRALTADGLAPGTDAAATTMLLDPGGAINIGAYADGSSSIHGYIRKATYLPRRMSNPELQAVTT